MKGFPDSGKIVVLAPAVAAYAAELAPELAGRIYTRPEQDPAVAFVIDLGKLFDIPGPAA